MAVRVQSPMTRKAPSTGNFYGDKYQDDVGNESTLTPKESEEARE